MQSRNPLFLVLVVVLTGLSIWQYVSNPFKLGLDVVGGARFVYQMNTEELSPEQQKNPARVQSRVANVLENRVGSALGVVEGTVSVRGTDQFIVELPDIKNIEEARQLLKSTAKIEVYHAKNVQTSLRQKRYSKYDETTENGAPVVRFVRTASPDKVLGPADPEYQEMIKGWDLILSGSEVKDATIQVMANSKGQPHFNFSDTKGEDGRSGQDKMADWSRRFSQQEENIAFVMDGVVLNTAPLKKGAILRESAFIDGEFDSAYLRKFVELINSGSLDVSLKEIGTETVDPTIGKKALSQMVTAGAISLGIICVYLIGYYSFPGVVAAIAMLLYTLFTLTVLKMMGATFSLASIAGFVLSAGMAVDANILVFERVKEEMKAGRKTLTAIEIGFKRALTAIVDSNISTIMTSLVLWTLGTGAVKGFATTLIVGVMISFFTAITVTRSLLLGVTSLGHFHDQKWYALGRNLFGEKLGSSDESKSWKILAGAKKYFLISAILVVVGWVFVGLGGIKPNVEFQGGFEGTYLVGTSDATPASVRTGLEQAGFKGANVKFATVENQRAVYITIAEQAGLGIDDPQAIQKIADAAGVPAENGSLRSIGPTIRTETVNNAIYGVLISSAMIVLYLAIRFGVALGGIRNGIKFGLSAVAALLHDVAFIIGSAGIVGFFLGWEISALFITSMLTVIGFSVHDTIIIFDRIRENLKKTRGQETFENLVDRSINQSVARSINTSMTAIVPLGILLFFGTPTPELKFMVLTMLLGILVGTYSSIFNAAPILYLWNKSIMKKKGEQHGLLQEAVRENKLRASSALAHSVTAADGAPGGDQGGYGTIKRKRSVREQATVELDDDE